MFGSGFLLSARRLTHGLVLHRSKLALKSIGYFRRHRTSEERIERSKNSASAPIGHECIFNHFLEGSLGLFRSVCTSQTNDDRLARCSIHLTTGANITPVLVAFATITNHAFTGCQSVSAKIQKEMGAARTWSASGVLMGEKRLLGWTVDWKQKTILARISTLRVFPSPFSSCQIKTSSRAHCGLVYG